MLLMIKELEDKFEKYPLYCQEEKKVWNLMWYRYLADYRRRKTRKW